MRRYICEQCDESYFEVEWSSDECMLCCTKCDNMVKIEIKE